MGKKKTKIQTKEGFPCVLEPNTQISFTELLDELTKNNAFFRENLLKHGALLFRGFPVSSVDDFGSIIESLNLGAPMDYIGGDSPRIKVKGQIYTSTEAPPHFKIPLHNELSFVNQFPKHIYFYCETPSATGGSTIIGDARKIYRDVDPKIRDRFSQKGLKYVSRYYYKSTLMSFINRIQKGHKTWIDVFETEDKKEVEKKCRENDFLYRWNKKDWIEISQLRPSEMVHPETQERVWFNQVHLYDFNPKLLGWGNYIGAKLVYFRRYTKLHEIFFSDATKIPRKEIYHIMDVLDANTVAFPWQKGDVMVLDNILAMHGRAPFTGKRRVLAAMTG